MDKCPLTGFETTFYNDPLGATKIHYTTIPTGYIEFTHIALNEINLLSMGDRYIVAGLSRHKKHTSFTSANLRTLQDFDFPHSFEQKADYFLRYLFENGGKEFKPQNFTSPNDSSLAYATPEEFVNIIRYLKNYGKIDYHEKIDTNVGTLYQGIILSKLGIEEIKKGVPNSPLFAVVDQKIHTGDPIIDERIEQAKILFFQDNSMETKRTACEKLSLVLEPIRNKLISHVDKDTDKFFEIVNKMNIRHHTKDTAMIKHLEIYEWIFYGLLNTINTYYKLMQKLNSNKP